MTTFFSKSVRRVTLQALLVAPLLAVGASCTDLTETPQDALTPSNAFKTDAEVIAGVASVYAGLRGTMWGYYNLSEITTDELLVPTRGQDWYDNGRWLEIHRQTWTPNSGSALDDMNGTWNALNSGVARANLMISIVEGTNNPQKAVLLAELRTLRAWYYYMLMDMFGGVPLVTSTEVTPRPRVTRDSLFKFIESELKAVRVALPSSRPAAEYGRLARGAADAILASMYLNAQVFQGTVTAAGLQRAPARWQEAINFADSVINSGVYTLNADWKGNFSITNENSPENIFVVVHSSVRGLGQSLPMRALHYNQLTPGPWNGFATLAETYRSFDPADARREIFLVGPQRSYNTGELVNDRQGRPLVFTDTIGDVTAANEDEGARLVKFPPLPGAADGDSHPNDYPFFRLAEMYLIKAEALNELGNPAAAIAEVNRVRQRQFNPPQLLSVAMTQAQARDAILRERLFELAGEGKRRQDLIRAGKFTDAHRMCSSSALVCQKAATDAFRVLMPIPQIQIDANPKLAQNAGY